MTHTKANKSKILALILGLTMCLALMLGIVFASPTSTAYAEGETLTPYDSIYVNSKALNSGWYLDETYTEQKGNPTSGYVAKYYNGVLTLNNYHGGEIGTSAPASGYYKIDLIGNNVITGGQRGVFIDTPREGRVTITSSANGKLTINASSAISVWGIACGASNSVKTTDVVIGGNAQVTINATSNGENKQVQGIHARNVTIEDNASVNITAKNTNSNTASGWVKGIFAKNNITINTNGKIEIDATVAGGTDAYSYGIDASNATYTKIKDMTIKWKKDGRYGGPVAGPEVDSTTHAINEDSENCIASYRYGTPRYVVAKNGKLAGPGVPESLDTDYGYFLAGDKIILNAPSLQVSETDTTNIPFDKWFSFANDTVITNATSQTGAILTVPNKDIIVWANYKAFTEQPVFERESDTTGNVTCTIISNNNEDWLTIKSIDDLDAFVYGFFNNTTGTTYQTTVYSDTAIPNGQYVVMVKYNGKTIYSEPFTADYTERKATVDSVTISGEQGEPIASTDVTVTLTGYTFATTLSGNWITNLPAGLIQSVTRISDTEAKITVSSTPTALSDQFVEITIPKANITGLASDLTVESNSDAKFNIIAPLTKIAVPKAKDNLTYTALTQIGVEEGEDDCYTLTGNSGIDAGNYTAIAKLKSGYKWNDGTIADKEIPWSIGKRNPVVSDFNFYYPSNLTYDGNAKTATVSLIAHYGDETGFAVTVKYKKGGVIVAEAKDAGEYEVYIDTTATANFNSATDIHDVSWKFTIAKKEQPAPSASLFTTVPPTTTTTTDGKITGITTQMEYRKAGETAWTSGTGSDVTGLSSGKYQIRFKETDNYKAGAVTEVVVPESGVSSYSLTVNNGTGGGVYVEGASVTITANAPGEDEIFIGWTIVGIDGLDTTQTSLTFNMPANAVIATANYKQYYKVTVENGNASVDGSVVEKAFENETVTITAIVNEGERFIKWEIVAGSVELSPDAEATTTFQMPAKNVTIKAIVQKVAPTPFPVGYLVYNGTEQTGVEEREGYTIKNGTAVDAGTYYATATLKDGYVWEDGKNDKERLVEWWIKKATRNAPTGLESEKASSVTAKDGKIKNTTTEMLYRKRGLADWEKVIGTEITGLSIGVYEVKFDESKNYNESDVAEIRVVAECNIVVTGGTGAGTYNTGDVATVKADAPAKGKVFAGWKDANGNIVSTDSNYTFTVMDGISLTAVYVDAPAEKNTLSGGQIAGIVIGSVAGVGIVGFAIFWFVVKKKTFADLITVIKETVNKVLKKGNKEE